MSLLNFQTLIIKRKDPGTYVNGYLVEGQEGIIETQGNIQPATGSKVDQLREFDQRKDIKLVFSEEELFENDIIFVKGTTKEYEVVALRDFSAFSFSHFEAFALSVTI